MRRVIPLLVVALAVAAFYFRDSWLPPPPGQANYLGYVEGETVLVAAPVAGRIVARPAAKGASVAAGDLLFSLDAAQETDAAAQADAAVKTAEATLADLMSGKRPAELEIYAAQRREAEAGLDLARKELARAADLASTGTAAQSRLDLAQSQVATYEARIAQIAANEDAARLAARDNEIAAARSRVAEARAAAAVAHRKVDDKSLHAPVAARVDNTFFEVGEWVAAGQPVVSLLPPDQVTLRFFVPEADLAAASPGTVIHFTCDGCGDPREARITRVSATPEYTPPVIYSEQARAKLVYLVEAAPASPDSRLRPGLPIEVEPLP
jgi:HlyD family secretion protein